MDYAISYIGIYIIADKIIHRVNYAINNVLTGQSARYVTQESVVARAFTAVLRAFAPWLLLGRSLETLALLVLIVCKALGVSALVVLRQLVRAPVNLKTLLARSDVKLHSWKPSRTLDRGLARRSTLAASSAGVPGRVF